MPTVKSLTVSFLLMCIVCGGCSSITAPVPSPTSNSTITATATYTETALPTLTATITATATITPTATIMPTETPSLPQGVVIVDMGHCRYGPGKAYLHAGDLYQGDHVTILNRNRSGSWLWVKPDKQAWQCWVAASLLQIEGDIQMLAEYYHPLPKTTVIGPPAGVTAYRKPDGTVVVEWSGNNLSKDKFRGFLIEATLCQGGYLVEVAVHTDKNAYTFSDEAGCPVPSHAVLYAVEKHGYTDPVTIPWPAP